MMKIALEIVGKNSTTDSKKPSSYAKGGLTALGAAHFYEDIKNVATYLANIWNETCQPAYSIVSQEQLQTQYELQPRIGGQVAIPNLYDFYVDRLHSSMDFITNHMRNIGFQYEPNTKKVTFSIPVGSSSSPIDLT
ncbi:uncharacterized protein LOC126846895 [Adelges cooleyi]|uniref:uncharacterized protein LOC126846895 n=1 Tax=Adelges cooleyi TaxID=133065 RepID=UPI00217FB723|nr:uncharacterized protein LOC126846895 [Adelges cooleyi]